MITIIISGPQEIGKTAIAKMIYKAMEVAGFISIRIYTTNETLVTVGCNLEDK